MSEFLKKHFENYEEQPSPEMWDKVMSDVRHHNAVVRARKIAVATTVIVAGGIAAFLLLNNKPVAENNSGISQVSTTQAVAAPTQTDATIEVAPVASSEVKTPAAKEGNVQKSKAVEPNSQKQNTATSATPIVVSQQTIAKENETGKNNIAETSEQLPLAVASNKTYSSEPASNSTASTTETATNTAATTHAQQAPQSSTNKLRAGSNPDSTNPQIEDVKIIVPTAFTPDRSENNLFYATCKHPEQIKSFELSIFTRNGLQLYHSKNFNDRWDGKYKGRIQPMGAYTYVLVYSTASGKKVEKGTVVIIR
ncbi:MAG: gliding motility-associated C-terminal domain-containing protein [Bacteroidales bacterium]|nr:gliding motility-associated C-terminal domain-containing protein [Bacteroidales bacterium]